MSQQYSASEESFNSLLSKHSSLFVPSFQRPYNWTEVQIQEFFEDVFKPIDWSIGTPPSLNDVESHYMGAVVLCKNDDGYMILDGQQRLTTITLVLSYIKASIINKSSGSSNSRSMQSARDIELKISKQTDGVSDELMPIIRPQEDDNRIFTEIFKSEHLHIPLEDDSLSISSTQKKITKQLRKRAMFKAYLNIKKFVDTYITKSATAGGIDEIKALVFAANRLLRSLSFVVIQAHNESAAFRLFETLNDRGLDLSAADLIKNNLFIIANNGQERELVKQKWEQVSNLIGSDLVSFLRTFWLMKHDFVRKDGLFDSYKSVLMRKRNEPNFLANFLDDLIESAEHFIEITQPQSDSGIKDDVIMLNDLGAKTCRPLLLVINIHKPQLFKEVSKIIESLTVRWMIVGKVFNVLETAYARIAVRISESIKDGKDDDYILTTIKSELSKLDVPDDQTFCLMFKKYDVTSTSRAIRHILCCINVSLSNSNELIADSSSVHIEHIFPQQPSTEALSHSEITQEESEDFSSKIGNITLLDAKINMSLKNKAFPDKLNAEKGYMHSRLAINDEIKRKTSWKKADIEARAELYATEALKIWKW